MVNSLAFGPAASKGCALLRGISFTSDVGMAVD